MSFQGYSGAGEWGGEQIKLKHTKLSVLIEIQPFFLNKYSLDYCRPLVNVHSSDKADSYHFCQYSCCFYGEDCQRSLFHHSHWHNSSLTLWLRQFFLTRSTFHLYFCFLRVSIFWYTISFLLDLESLWTFMRHFHIILWCIFTSVIMFTSKIPLLVMAKSNSSIWFSWNSTPLLDLLHSIYLWAKSITPTFPIVLFTCIYYS